MMSNPKTEVVIAYICDGHDKCSMEPGCFMREDLVGASDMVCRHTTKAEHAVNGPCEDPENYPERFVYVPDDEKIKYYELLPGEEL